MSGGSGSGRGLFLAIEGVEGSGKSTQIERLSSWLGERGVPVTVAREPGGTPLGEKIREVVLRDLALEVPAWSEFFLMLAARRAFVQQVVLPVLQRGEVMLADRYELSTFAYQGGGRGLPEEEMRRCNRLATGGLSPDVTILLEVDPADGVARQRSAGKRADRLETERDDFHRRVAEAYARMAASDPAIARIDATASPDQVHRRIVAALLERVPGTILG